MKKIFIGIDVSKSKLDVTLLCDSSILEQITILNRESSIKDYFDYLFENYPSSLFYIGYEATSNYMITLQKILKDLNVKHKLLNPYLLHYYFKSKGFKNKDDKVDSYVIALYLSEQKESFFTKDEYHYRYIFKPYIAALEQLKKQRVALKNMLHSQKDVIDKDLREQISDIEKKILEVQKEIEKRAKDKLQKEIPEFKKIKDELKGVGDTTLLYVLPYIADNYQVKSAKQFVSFFGLNPVHFQSGSSVYKSPRISKRGNKNVRKLLFLSSLSAVRTNEVIKQKYNRLLQNGKSKKQALIACASHLLRAIYYKYIHFHQGLNLETA